MGLKSIFIVDDDQTFGRSLNRLLKIKGISAEWFQSAEHFIDCVPSFQQGIMIVDIHLPDCDGFQLMGKMRKMGYSMPVILITGRTEKFTREMALQSGAVGFLQKPFSEKSLLNLIESLEDETE